MTPTPQDERLRNALQELVAKIKKDELRKVLRAALAAPPQEPDPCSVCNALIVQRNATHYDAKDLAAADVRAKILHARINAAPSPQAAPEPMTCSACGNQLPAGGCNVEDRCNAFPKAAAALAAPSEPVMVAADPNCRHCRGTGIDGDVNPDGSVGDVDCSCRFRHLAPKREVLAAPLKEAQQPLLNPTDADGKAVQRPVPSPSVEHAACSYYESCFRHQRPEWVPSTVMVLREVRSDLPFHRAAILKPGAVPVECNQWGAVSARADDGSMLGLKPDEFDVLTWKSVAEALRSNDKLKE